ncbi:unnamed protein product [Brachionus calyciflorus]|uniref:Uncharacterized protein n=1 Tax=Brachionus calyciflorus TaxID=104777 RepID=A0A813YBL7_9BILA|nr:unnamed protein product [Brachionus calyciflorus]
MTKYSILILLYFAQNQAHYNTELSKNEEYIDLGESYLHFGSNNFSLNFDYTQNVSVLISNSNIIIDDLNFIEFSNTVEDLLIIFYLNKVILKEIDMDFKFRTTNNKILSSSENCDILSNQTVKSKNRFYINELHFINLTYPKKFCPAIFQMLFVDDLYLYKINDTNKIDFQSINLFDTLKNPSILKIIITKSNFTLDKGLMSKMLIQYLSQIEITNSNLIDIREDTFYEFSKFSLINLSILNFKDFIKKPNKWMNFGASNKNTIDFKDCYYFQKIGYLNVPNQLALVLKDLSNNYDYPDTDFCNFIYLNQNYIVYPIIEGKKNLNCTCTLIWLLLNWRLKDYLYKFGTISQLYSMQTESTNVDQKKLWMKFISNATRQ